MATVREVVDSPSKARIRTLETQVQKLKDDLSNQRTSVDHEKVVLRAKLSTQSGQLSRYIKKEEKIKEYVSEVVLAVTAQEPLPRVQFFIPKKVENKTPITAVLHLTDWHIGERNSSDELEGWGGYDWGIAQDRVLNQLIPAFIAWVNTQRSGYNIRDLVIVETGDFVSGDIHEELKVTNEFPLPIQTAKAGQLLGTVHNELAPHFDNVYVKQIGGDNHSRLVRKPQAAGKAQNSMGYLVYEIANEVARKNTNVHTERAEGMKMTFKIGNFTFLGEHGDTVKSWMGVPFYGIERERAREATRRMHDGRGFHYLILGHWHSPIFAGQADAAGMVVGGCLGGTTAYDHSCGRISPPSQSAFLVGKRGAFGFVPFRLK